MSELVAENTLKTAELNALEKKINQIKKQNYEYS